MQKLSDAANRFGDPAGRPYFSIDGVRPVSRACWASMRSKFNCPHGVTNVWERSPVRGEERVKVKAGRAVHLNQKPLDLMTRIIESSTDVGERGVGSPLAGFSAHRSPRASSSAEPTQPRSTRPTTSTAWNASAPDRNRNLNARMQALHVEHAKRLFLTLEMGGR